MFERYYISPAGMLRILANDNGITSVHFVKDELPGTDVMLMSNPIIDTCVAQLDAYFSRQCKTFSIPLDPQGTYFQKKVWSELQKIPYGRTVSYLQIAKALGDPNKIRAVGGANGKNPIAIIIPCHRVIGSDGSLTGYAGGMDKKRWLLKFEGALNMGLFG